ncbi:MAG: adenosylhomocysteinase [Candidatus Omnitrophica bacterium]|nr:adenosylhomocysteinase [Candidatus Omnitrophota bacterium]
MTYDIKDISLAKKGSLRIEWARNHMPVLSLIRERFRREKPLAGATIACCLHVTTETGVLSEVLKAGGAKVFVCASNPLSTQDDVASSLVKYDKIPVFAVKGEDTRTYYRHIKAVLDPRPVITMDDGADLVSSVHQRPASAHANLIGGTEETTTGVIRLRALANENKLRYPIIAVNDAMTKHMFDNRYGTGQSTIDGILRATNQLMSGSIFVVCGYGWCGKGVAMRAKGMGSQVVVTEVDPLRALEAAMDGFQVMKISSAARIGDVFLTTTGDTSVIRKEHFALMKDGALIANSGHFNVEIDIPGLESLSVSRRTIREFVEEFTLKNGRRVYLLGQGRLINLAAAEGHPAAVMDMSFANQALSAEYMLKHHRSLAKQVYKVPDKIDARIASLKLKTMGITIDTLTAEQRRYLASWEIGT